MTTTVATDLMPRHSTSVAQRETRRTTNVDRSLAHLRKAIKDAGYTLDALVAAMQREPSYKSYVSRVVNGDKPYTLEFEGELPDDVLQRFRTFQAESHGLVVIEQADEETARRQFAQGLFNLFVRKRAALPERAGEAAKATLPESRKSRIA